jgi:biopolymer transport protein ExbD
MSAVYQRGRRDLQANLTPMIDVTFLLIVFFVLVSQIVEVESVELDLPEPEHAASMRLPDEQRLVINVWPSATAPGEVRGYKVGPRLYPADEAGLDALIEHIAAAYRSNPELAINLRADRATRYEWVEPAMQAVVIAAARIDPAGITPRINLVVVKED